MDKSKNTLCLYGMYNGKKYVLSKNFKDVSNAAKYTSKFHNEYDLINYFKENTSIPFTNITLEKTYADSNKIPQESHIFYKQENMYCTIDNLTEIFLYFSRNNDFIEELLNDPYIESAFKYMKKRNPRASLRTQKQEDDKRIRSEKGNEFNQYAKLKEDDMKDFLELALYTSTDKEKRKPKKAVLRYLFGKYVPKDRLMVLVNRLDLKPNEEEFDFKYDDFVSEELLMLDKRTLLENNKVEEEQINMFDKTDNNTNKEDEEETERTDNRLRDDDLYPDTPKFGDGNLDNPDYVESAYVSPFIGYDERNMKRPNESFTVRDDGTRVSIKWRGKDLSIRINNKEHIMSPASAFKKWYHDKYMLMALRDFLDGSRNKTNSRSR